MGEAIVAGAPLQAHAIFWPEERLSFLIVLQIYVLAACSHGEFIILELQTCRNCRHVRCPDTGNYAYNGISQQFPNNLSSTVRTFSDRFRIISDPFRSFLDCFGTFSNRFGPCRIVSNRFGSFLYHEAPLMAVTTTFLNLCVACASI